MYRAATNIPSGAPVLRMVIAALFTPAIEGATPRELETNVTGRADMTVAEDVAVCGLPNSRVVVAWSETEFEAGDQNIKAMILTENGGILTTPEPRVGIQINSALAGQQRMPSIALSTGEVGERIGIAWHDDSVSGPGPERPRGQGKDRVRLAPAPIDWPASCRLRHTREANHDPPLRLADRSSER